MQMRYLLPVLVLAAEPAWADWRGWFDDYGKTYEECLDIQRIKFLEDPKSNIKVNEARVRARSICQAKWERASESLKQVSWESYQCRYSWPVKNDPDIFLHIIPAGERRPSISFVPIQTIELKCRTGPNGEIPEKVAVLITINGSERSFDGFFSGASLHRAYFDFGLTLKRDDDVSLTIKEFLVDENAGKWVRK